MDRQRERALSGKTRRSPVQREQARSYKIWVFRRNLPVRCWYNNSSSDKRQDRSQQKLDIGKIPALPRSPLLHPAE